MALTPHGSAFVDTIYAGVPRERFKPLFDRVYEALRRAAPDIKPKFFMVHDAALMFHQDAFTVRYSLKQQPSRPTLWWSIVGTFTSTPEYFELNALTRGDVEASALAAALFIKSVFEVVGDPGREGVIIDPGARTRLCTGAGVIKRCLLTLKSARDLAARLTGGRGFEHDALSAIEFLENPDEFRRRLQRLRVALRVTESLLDALPASKVLERARGYSGPVTGVKPMEGLWEALDLLPEELALSTLEEARPLFAAKVATRQAMVWRRGRSPRFAIYVDKSGSMGDAFEEGGVDKISVAAGAALAILHRYPGSRVYLFDTEVEEVDARGVVDALLRVKAGGGTDIARVLETVAEVGREVDKHVIITDAIDEVERGVVERLVRDGIAKRVVFIIVPPGGDAEWLRAFKTLRVSSLAGFRRAVREAVTEST